jgi:WD40 repeat protein
VRTLDEHTDAVTAAQIDCMKIVSASKDATVRVWDLRSGNPLYIFEGHTKGINCLRFKNDLMVSAGDDKMVRVWQF